MKKCSSFVAFIALVALGCSLQSCEFIAGWLQHEIRDSFNKVNNGLGAYNDFQKSSTDSLYAMIAIHKALNVELYFSALQVREECRGYREYVDSLNAEIVSMAGGIDTETNEVKKGMDIEIPTQLLVKDGKGDTLLLRREELKDVLLNACSTDSARQRLMFTFNDETPGPGTRQSKKIFNNVPVVAALTILTAYKNDCLNCEKEVLKDIIGRLK